MRIDRRNNIIILGIDEEELPEGWEINEVNEVVDKYHVENILDEIYQENLKKNVVDIRRLGRKEIGKTRPLRVQFQNSWERDTVIINAHILQYSEDYNTAFIRKDMIRQDRAAAYMARQRRRQETTENSRQDVADRDQTTPQEDDSSQVRNGEMSDPRGVEEQGNT